VSVLEPADELAILRLVALADACATRRDGDGYAALFAEDATMDGDMGQVSGRAALAAAVAAVWAAEPAGTLHLTCNATVSGTADDPVVASIVVMLSTGADGVSLSAADVVQRVARTETGWRIRSRRIMIRPTGPDVTNEEVRH